MTDHIPLAEARPGDMVFLKPVMVSPFRADNHEDRLFAHFTEGVRLLVPADIDHIERAPRVLQVGDRVRTFDMISGEVVFVEGKEAVIRSDLGTGLWVKPLTDLEPVE